MNGSVRSIADRLAATVWVLALKMQLLQKCGLGLICLFESGFGGGSMPQGRHYLAATFDFYGAFGTAVPDAGCLELFEKRETLVLRRRRVRYEVFNESRI